MSGREEEEGREGGKGRKNRVREKIKNEVLRDSMEESLGSI